MQDLKSFLDCSIPNIIKGEYTLLHDTIKELKKSKLEWETKANQLQFENILLKERLESSEKLASLSHNAHSFVAY